MLKSQQIASGLAMLQCLLLNTILILGHFYFQAAQDPKLAEIGK
jgi:hypothetical protein